MLRLLKSFRRVVCVQHLNAVQAELASWEDEGAGEAGGLEEAAEALALRSVREASPSSRAETGVASASPSVSRASPASAVATGQSEEEPFPLRRNRQTSTAPSAEKRVGGFSSEAKAADGQSAFQPSSAPSPRRRSYPHGKEETSFLRRSSEAWQEGKGGEALVPSSSKTQGDASSSRAVPPVTEACEQEASAETRRERKLNGGVVPSKPHHCRRHQWTASPDDEDSDSLSPLRAVKAASCQSEGLAKKAAFSDSDASSSSVGKEEVFCGDQDECRSPSSSCADEETAKVAVTEAEFTFEEDEFLLASSLWEEASCSSLQSASAAAGEAASRPGCGGAARRLGVMASGLAGDSSSVGEEAAPLPLASSPPLRLPILQRAERLLEHVRRSASGEGGGEARQQTPVEPPGRPLQQQRLSDPRPQLPVLQEPLFAGEQGDSAANPQSLPIARERAFALRAASSSPSQRQEELPTLFLEAPFSPPSQFFRGDALSASPSLRRPRLGQFRTPPAAEPSLALPFLHLQQRRSMNPPLQQQPLLTPPRGEDSPALARAAAGIEASSEFGVAEEAAVAEGGSALQQQQQSASRGETLAPLLPRVGERPSALRLPGVFPSSPVNSPLWTSLQPSAAAQAARCCEASALQAGEASRREVEETRWRRLEQQGVMQRQSQRHLEALLVKQQMKIEGIEALVRRLVVLVEAVHASELGLN